MRVLYLHGLESNPERYHQGDGNSKWERLVKAFPPPDNACCGPDLLTGRRALNRRHSIGRSFVSLREVRAAGASSFLCLSATLAGAVPLRLGLPGALAPLAYLAVHRRRLLELSVAASMEGSLGLALAAVGSFQPDVVVGMSWGGALAALCLQRAAYTGPLLLLAPACEAIAGWLPPGSKLQEELRRPLPARTRGLVVHGTADAITLLRDSEALCRGTRLGLRVSQGDGHMLLRALQGRKLGRLVKEAAAV